MFKKAFTVLTEHPVSGSKWNGAHTVSVSSYGEKFFASAAAFGCGKDADTPEAAIRSLVTDNGATVVELRQDEPEAEDHTRDMTTSQQLDQLKADRAFYEAGAFAFRNGLPCEYGCHFGLRSNRAFAVEQFTRGYAEAKAEADEAPKARVTLIEQSATLNLLHDTGDDAEPEQWWVQDRNQPDRMGSLAVALDFEELDGRTLRPSEIETVTRWSWKHQ